MQASSDTPPAPGHSPRYILVDVDGTLVDSLPGISDCFLRALSANGTEAPPEEQVRRIAGPPMIDTLKSLGLTGSLLESTYADYRSCYSGGGWRNCRPYPGMKELLYSWKDAGIVLATATSKVESSARMMLEHLGVLNCFEVIATATEGEHGRRTKTEVVGYALESLGLDPTPVAGGGPSNRSDILLVGDRIHDVEGAHAYGVRSILVDWGYGGRDEHAASDWSVAEVGELERVVADWADDRPHICVVCTGNICRSPMGEIMLRRALQDAGLGDAVRLNSCGTTGWHVGEAVDPRAAAWLQRQGYTASGHAAAEFGPEHRDADLFLVMDASNRKALEKAGVDPARIALFRSFGPAGDREVADPYYGDDADFDRAGRELDDALPGIVAWARDRVRRAPSA
ncbi:arsenate reductase/protein-tyrosine-phosphatase family protein [Corynebacterium provencense]|uniref:arsenate reductase/protein-tyrosine-phosphatase family protein n=1 Tax=Corynebacterium provencense TaxID=1737425 RepID=UPI000833F3CF|nr:HAD hydrolase-like protein [Corynebacterium provencense]